MPKIAIEPVRRKQLIDATYDSIYEYGLTETTIAKISQYAGVSTGIISHYFGGKNELLEAAMREMLKNLRKSVSLCTARATTPEEKILAIIEGNFFAEQTMPRSVTTWLAFWAQAMHVAPLARLQRANKLRLQSNLCYWFKQLLPADQAIIAAEGMAALIDGLWLRGGFETEGIDAKRAHRIASMYLTALLDRSSVHKP